MSIRGISDLLSPHPEQGHTATISPQGMQRAILVPVHGSIREEATRLHWCVSAQSTLPCAAAGGAAFPPTRAAALPPACATLPSCSGQALVEEETPSPGQLGAVDLVCMRGRPGQAGLHVWEGLEGNKVPAEGISI